MNAALGGVSAGGIGSPEFDVTQTGGGPNAFVASHGGGNAGGVTPSKFSVEVTRPAQGGHCPRRGRIPALVGAIAMPTATSNNNKTTFRSRIGVSARFKVLIIGAAYAFTKSSRALSSFSGVILVSSAYHGLGRATGVNLGVACGLGGTDGAGRGAGVGRGRGVDEQPGTGAHQLI